ncbi:LiaF transmembrane domain-containing protein [Companilactobacillus ginsenosidimutans]|uniref:LiaF transmembrane domain-containing protein n=1 Tax=Companilactobacillus ginsenosidimutans TaxID=1007676 RepID=A0A0H4R171_9LACO|nr:hypothetical protein [Companilactobacillus ginsenosidimutans]AKP67450.1 hypothetical protein ABM34_07840 [Companilactobacillus ginsenosidimutans]
MRNRNGIFWGLFLLVGAGVLVASQLHMFTIDMSIWKVVLTIFLVAIFIKSVVYYAIPGAVFSLAFLAIIYAKFLGITTLVPWTILGAALLISIGLSLVFRPLLIKHRPWMNHHYGAYRGMAHHGENFNHNHRPVDVQTSAQSNVEVSVRMGSSVRYITSDDFQSADITVSMGNAKVYFENVTIKDTAEINLDVSLGGLDLFIPKNWNLVNEMKGNDVGTVDEVGFKDVDSDSPTVYLRGISSWAGLKINYI